MLSRILILSLASFVWAKNSTIYNPILPGFHPDPSCIFVPEFNDTFFCASSSFLAFPGLPIHASKDLQNWNLVSHGLSRPDQLSNFSQSRSDASGIWAPTLRFRNGVFYLVTTLVDDDKPKDDSTRWDNVIFTTTDPFNSSAWSDPIHFKFDGYDTGLFWDHDDQTYATGCRMWEVEPSIDLATIDIATGKVGPQTSIWTGTGAIAPEGPRIYQKDGYYYLIIAEGGTGLGHMVTGARSQSIWGPYTENPANPILTNTNTTEYSQAVGHADFFQDGRGAWWGVAHAFRFHQEQPALPMGRETVLFPLTWRENEWPFASRVRGIMSAWRLPGAELIPDNRGTPVSASEVINFAPDTDLPSHLTHWYIPNNESCVIDADGQDGSILLTSSPRNLTGSSDTPNEVTLLARRQVHTLFRYSIHMKFNPQHVEAEAGITLFVASGEHVDLGLVALPSRNKSSLIEPHLRIRGETQSSSPVETQVFELPKKWQGEMLYLEIAAFNGTHYSFAAGPANHRSDVKTFAYIFAGAVRSIFTGALVGVYVTSNGHNNTSQAAFKEWTYQGYEQFRN